MNTVQLFGFGAGGWGGLLLRGAAVTVLVSVCAFLLGLCLGALGAWGKLSRSRVAGAAASAYTTVLRGVPDLLVIYLVYFGGSQMLGGASRLFGGDGFVGVNGFAAGVVAVGVVSGAYQTEVLRAAWLAVPRGQWEAARALGLPRRAVLRRVMAPQALRLALPGLGNVWQMVVKESALVSVTGLVELMRQVQVAAGSTRRPFEFYMAGAVLYLVLTAFSDAVFRWAERRASRRTARDTAPSGAQEVPQDPAAKAAPGMARA